MDAAEAATVQRITNALIGKELDAGQISVETQLPVSRVVHILGPKCKEGGPYLRRDVGGVYKYSLRPVEQLSAAPFNSVGQLVAHSVSESPPQEPVPERDAHTGINPQQRRELLALLDSISAPQQIIDAFTQHNYGAVTAYSARYRAALAVQEQQLKERIAKLGRLEEILRSA